MAPFEVMISESQERMLAIVEPAQLDAVLAVCRRWNLPAAVIGVVTDDGDVTVVSDGAELARIPARALASDAIVHRRVGSPPTHRRAAPAPGAPAETQDLLPERGMDPGLVLQALLGHPNLASRAWMTTQYDATVGADTLSGSGLGAATLRVKGTTKGLVMATDAAERIGEIDPYLGAAMAVAECTRNVSITGARPLGVTNCLNFGNPERPEAFWQLQEAVRGLGDACRALGLPVTGGNVSLYNESLSGAVPPTTQIGVVGLLDDLATRVGPAFGAAGDLVMLAGDVVPGLGGSVYAEIAGSAPDDGAPALDLAREAAVQRFVREAARLLLLRSAQDVSGGGLAVALAESCLWGEVGADIQLPVGATPAMELFGEGPGRIVMSCKPEQRDALMELAQHHEVPLRSLGLTGGERLRIRLVGEGATGAAESRGAGVADELDEPLVELRHAWEAGLPRALGEEEWLAMEHHRTTAARGTN